MKKFAYSMLICCASLCGILSAQSQESTLSTKIAVEKGCNKCSNSQCPIEQANTQLKIKKDGVYEVQYSLQLIQKGITTVHAAPGLIVDRTDKSTQTTQTVYYAIRPQTYVIDGTTKHQETRAHCTGLALLRLVAGDRVRIGLMKTQPGKTPLITTIQQSTMSAKLTSSK